MTEDLVLIFAYHFPPENAAGAARPFRFYKYLPRFGYECYVITAADVSSLPDLKAAHVADPFIARPREGFGWQVERFVRKFFLPGVAGTRWAVHAYRTAVKFLEQNSSRRVTILSTFPPLGTLLAGFLLARRARLPWIADFRDPLADNPGSGDLNDFQQLIHRRLERLFLNRAGCVIANTDAAEEKLKSAYPQHTGKIHRIWNGFDPEQRLGPSPLPERPFRVYSHVGELYEGRTVAPLLHSLKRLIDSGRVDPADIKIRLVGASKASSLPDPEFLKDASNAGWLELAPSVPQDEAHFIMRLSDGLLLIQPHSTVQIPGKLYDYLQIGRPVLAFVPPDSAIERVLQKSGVPYRCCYSSDTPAAFDESVLQFFELDTAPVQPGEWFEHEFNAEHHAGKLAHLIEALNGSKRLR